MRIVFELPEWDNEWVNTRPFTSTGGVRHCYACRLATPGPMVRFTQSWWHVGCLEETFAADAVKNKLLSAWLMVAMDVARYPSKHSASEIRAVIRNLIAGPMMNALWRAGKEEGERGNRENQAASKLGGSAVDERADVGPQPEQHQAARDGHADRDIAVGGL